MRILTLLSVHSAAARQAALEAEFDDELGEEEGDEEEQDRLPSGIFRRQIHDPQALSAQPVSLKTAMK